GRLHVEQIAAGTQIDVQVGQTIVGDTRRDHIEASQRARGQRAGLGIGAAGVVHVHDVGAVADDGKCSLDVIDDAARHRLRAAHVDDVYIRAPTGIYRRWPSGRLHIESIHAHAAVQEGIGVYGGVADEDGVATGAQVDIQVGDVAVSDAAQVGE